MKVNGSLINDRKELLDYYCRGKSVLDIGCASGIGEDTSKFTHENIRKVAKEATGIDINRKTVDLYRKKGYNILHGDALNFSLKKKFDVVFAGEVMEHIADQGKFLENAKRHIKSNGILIITVPNAHDLAYHINRLFRRYSDDYHQCKNIGHVLFHSYGTLKTLLEGHGFKVKDYGYVNDICITWRRRMMKIITRIFPDFAMSIFVVATLD